MYNPITKIPKPQRLKAGYDFAAKQPQFNRFSIETLEYAVVAYQQLMFIKKDLYYLGMAHYVRDLLIAKKVAA
ncbi:hypothetical protein [Sporomusa sp.]|uniref:hypothetical protein n=1 Tax=Sporomusa sp. TaxID=2078658 RepID=UPI002B7F3FA9|nr:hypothetical protein [Sporomusa sp.]HWR06172.1 hypothetical protein [Sporomusa sp.]